MNLARSSIAAEEKNRKQKTSQNGKQNEGEVAPSFTPSFPFGCCILSRSTQEQGNAETRNFIETLNFNINKTVNAGDKYINTMTLIQHTEAGKHRVFKGETKLDNH